MSDTDLERRASPVVQDETAGSMDELIAALEAVVAAAIAEHEARCHANPSAL